MGVASSTTTLFRTIGGSFGVALMGTLFADQVHQTMADRLGAPGGRATGGAAQLDAASLAKLPEPVRAAYEYAVADGTHVVFLIGALVAILGFAAAWFLKEVPLRGSEKPEEVPA
jgi:hypothetical protein